VMNKCGDGDPRRGFFPSRGRGWGRNRPRELWRGRGRGFFLPTGTGMERQPPTGNSPLPPIVVTAGQELLSRVTRSWCLWSLNRIYCQRSKTKSRNRKGTRPCAKWVQSRKGRDPASKQEGAGSSAVICPVVLDSWSEQGTFIHVAFSIYTWVDGKPLIGLVSSLVRFATSIWWSIGPTKRRKKYLTSVTS